MPKFANVQRDLEGAFAGATWTATNITTVPQNYQGPNNATEFVRVNILPGQTFDGYNAEASSGMLRLDLFVPSGLGISRAMAIADILDPIVSRQVFTNGTQTGASTVNPIGIDPENAGFFRASYSVPYRHYS